MVTIVGSWALVEIDIREHRLPDSITLSLWGLSAAATMWLAASSPSPAAAIEAVVASAVCVGGLWLLAEFPGQPLGFGDVKLGGLIGIQLGWYGLETALLAIVLAFVAGGLYALVGVSRGSFDARSQVAFGPWMVFGWMAALVLSPDSREKLAEII